MQNKLLLKILASVNAISGIIILFSVIAPILSYESYLSPVPKDSTDYTKASNWFPGALSKESFVATGISFYTISIPRLKIENATVAIAGEDLSKNLIQYPGTALPGKHGNSVIFGHSILPIYFDPKNYMAIFSTLPTLKNGDEIRVYYDGILYKYKVESKFEVLPTDIEILEQNPSDSFLTLVTCVPPGDPRKLKRLIVRARIVQPGQAYESIRN